MSAPQVARELVTAHLHKDIAALKFSVEHMGVDEAGSVLGATVVVAGTLIEELAKATNQTPVEVWQAFCTRYAGGPT